MPRARGKTTAWRRRCGRAPCCSRPETCSDQTVRDIVSERAKNERRLALPARLEREPLEADHRVPAPVREPVITGDHGADLIAHRRCTRGVGDASVRRNDE